MCLLPWLNCVFSGLAQGLFFSIQMEAACRLVKLIQLRSVGAWGSLGHLIAANDSTGLPEQQQVAPSSAGFKSETLCSVFAGLGSGDCTGTDSSCVVQFLCLRRAEDLTLLGSSSNIQGP